MREVQKKSTISWSDLDKIRLFGMGSVFYSGLTLCLHPLSVMKTRQQVMSSVEYPKLTNWLSYEKVKNMYRGLGVVITIAIPARMIYMTVLEKSKEDISNFLAKMKHSEGKLGLLIRGSNESSIAAISGGIAGGIAGLSSQVLIVPMDVISQRQMVGKGNANQIYQSLIQKEGWRGLYRGFGISMMSSVPGGVSWWATYTACQEALHQFHAPIYSGIDDEGPFGEMNSLGRNAVIQIISGSAAAVASASITQPLDVIKTRLQVGSRNVRVVAGKNESRQLLSLRPSIVSVAHELMITEGVKGLYRGIGPRIINIGIWGTLFSSAYELLKLACKKDS